MNLAGDAEVDLRTFGCPNQTCLQRWLNGTGLVGESIGENTNTAPLTAGGVLLPAHNHQQWICHVEGNYAGNYKEIIRVTTAQTLGYTATAGGKDNVTNTNMMPSASSAAGANVMILRVRKRATRNEYDRSGDVSHGSKKQAGKVSVGHAMRKELYTSIIEDMPEMNSQDLYSMVLEHAAREMTPAPQKCNKKCCELSNSN